MKNLSAWISNGGMHFIIVISKINQIQTILCILNTNQSASISNCGMQATWYHSEHAEHSTIVTPLSGSQQVRSTAWFGCLLPCSILVQVHGQRFLFNAEQKLFSMQSKRWGHMRDWVKVTLTRSIPLEMLAAKATAKIPHCFLTSTAHHNIKW